LAWLMALGCAGLALPSRDLLAQDLAVRISVARSTPAVDAALRDSLNLSVRAAEGLQSDQVVPWANIERGRLNAVLRGLGYYEGNVHIEVDRNSDSKPETNTSVALPRPASSGQFHLSFVPILGPLYHIGSVRIVETANAEAPSAVDGESELIDRARNEVASADVLAELEAVWLSRQRQAGHALATVTKREITPDPSSRDVNVALFVQVGPPSRLGPVQFQGLQRVDPQSLEQYIHFRPGDPYRPEQIDRLRATMKSLPLFQSVQVNLASAPDVSGLLPVTVTVIETPPATRRLMLSGIVGTAVLGLTAVMLAVSLVVEAGSVAAWQRCGRQLSAGTWIFLLASALLALQRLLFLGDV
jgi:surface antigen-like variable number repeat protein